jgi:hypothetical protein
MTRAQHNLINNHLTTLLLEQSQRLTEGEKALLEFLCTDSIYGIKDDFDRGLNADLWYTENLEIGDQAFGGVLYSTRPDGDESLTGATSILRSRLAGWTPNRRATFQTRATLSGVGSHLELGFVKQDHIGIAATLQSSSSLLRGAESFGLAIRSPNVSGWYVASGGASGTSHTATTTRVAETGWSTFMVAVNEQGETRLWVNGQHNNEFARQTTMHVTQGHYLWVQSVKGSLSLDYVQGWQERNPI